MSETTESTLRQMGFHQLAPGPLADEILAKHRPYPGPQDESGDAFMTTAPDLAVTTDGEPAAVWIRPSVRRPAFRALIEDLALAVMVRAASDAIPVGAAVHVADFEVRIRQLCDELIAGPPLRDAAAMTGGTT